MGIMAVMSYLLFIAGLFLVVYGVVTLYYRSKHDEQKYRLYRVRDKLVNLAVDGKIEKKLFMKLYKLVNDIIVSVDKYDLVRLAKILKEAENLPRKEIENPYVKEVLKELADVLFHIIIDNSLLLKLLVWRDILKEISSQSRLANLPQVYAYKEVQEFQRSLINHSGMASC